MSSLAVSLFPTLPYPASTCCLVLLPMKDRKEVLQAFDLETIQTWLPSCLAPTTFNRYLQRAAVNGIVNT